MIIYLTISLITLCFCRITYLRVRHKRENAVVDYNQPRAWIQDNDIIVTGATTAQTIVRSNHNINGWPYDERDYFIPLRETKKNFLPKKDIKSHTLVERKFNPITIRPGAYIREVDVSIYNDFFRDRRRYNE